MKWVIYHSRCESGNAIEQIIQINHIVSIVCRWWACYDIIDKHLDNWMRVFQYERVHNEHNPCVCRFDMWSGTCHALMPWTWHDIFEWLNRYATSTNWPEKFFYSKISSHDTIPVYVSHNGTLFSFRIVRNIFIYDRRRRGNSSKLWHK